MNNLQERRTRYMRDSLPVRLGGLAANLARVCSFSNNPGNKEAVSGLLDESKHFIEWIAPETQDETTVELARLQKILTHWQRILSSDWMNDETRSEMGREAKVWSNEILLRSGLLDKK